MKVVLINDVSQGRLEAMPDGRVAILDLWTKQVAYIPRCELIGVARFLLEQAEKNAKDYKIGGIAQGST